MMIEKKTVILGAALVAIAGLAAAVFGYLPGPLKEILIPGGAGLPPCDQLPSVVVAEHTVDQSRAKVARLRELDPQVRVEIDTPCPDRERALLVIWVSDEETRERVESWRDEDGGFGLPTVVRVTSSSRQ